MNNNQSASFTGTSQQANDRWGEQRKAGSNIRGISDLPKPASGG